MRLGKYPDFFGRSEQVLGHAYLDTDEYLSNFFVNEYTDIPELQSNFRAGTCKELLLHYVLKDDHLHRMNMN